MKIVKSFKDIELGPCGVVIGNFDGLHVGHRDLLSRVVDDCKKCNRSSVVITFYPHPLQVLNYRKNYLINSYSDRREFISSLGVDLLCELDFSRNLSMLSPESFLRDYLLANKGLEKFFLGYDFSFGKNKLGDHVIVTEFCKEHGLDFTILPEYRLEDLAVSSTVIRQELSNGNMEKVNRFLGRPFFLRGTVIRGQERGREFPTAKLLYKENFIVPGGGVYATKISCGNACETPALVWVYHMNNEWNVEAYLINFDHDVYGSEMKIVFYKQLRNICNIAQFAEELTDDISVIKKMFLS